MASDQNDYVYAMRQLATMDLTTKEPRPLTFDFDRSVSDYYWSADGRFVYFVSPDQDRRAGVIQSEMLYKSLKILNKPVEYVRYPQEGHELSRSGHPKHRMDRLDRIIEFFDRFIR